MTRRDRPGRGERSERDARPERAERTALEERIAHLEREVSELSSAVAARDAELRRLAAAVERLTRREAERAAEEGGGVMLGDERPPHW